MNKAPINKTLTLDVKGILVMNDELIGIEIMETGEIVPLVVLLDDFADKIVSMSICYNDNVCCNSNKK